MKLGIWLAGLALSLSWTGGAIAQTPPAATPSPATEPATPPPEPTATVELPQTFTLPDTFSIQMPATWFVVGDEATHAAVLTSYNPDRTAVETPQLTDIRTEVMLVEENPNTYVGREIDALISGDRLIERYGYAAVDGQSAFRIWLAESPLPDYTRQVITFVGYDDLGTVKLVTHYNDTSTATADLIVAIHRSFELIR